MRRRLRSERGFTLIELIAALAVGTLLILATFDLLFATGNRQVETEHRTQATNEVQVGLARLTRELHQAASFNFLNSQVIDVNTWVRSNGGPNASLLRVRYDCSTNTQCRRYESAVGAALPSTYSVLADGVMNADVFDPQPDFLDPVFVGVKLSVRLGGALQPIVVSDGTNLPNLG